MLFVLRPILRQGVWGMSTDSRHVAVLVARLLAEG